MKEIEQKLKQSEKNSIEIVQSEKKQIEYTFDSSLVPHRGHKIWEINAKTLEVKEAEFAKVNDTINFHDAESEIKKGNVKEIIKRKGFYYISALNSESALKRLREGKGNAKISNHKKPINFF